MLTRYPLKRGTARPVLLEYVDGIGDQSMRSVMPLAIAINESRKTPSSTYLQARCSIAKAVRTFRFDRIKSLIDPDDGEVFFVADWLASLQLGNGQSFALFDEYSEDDEADQHPEIDPSPSGFRPLSRPKGRDLATTTEVAPIAALPPARRAWRAIFIAMAMGYVIGRLRLFHYVLRYLQAHHGLWL